MRKPGGDGGCAELLASLLLPWVLGVCGWGIHAWRWLWVVVPEAEGVGDAKWEWALKPFRGLGRAAENCKCEKRQNRAA